MRRIVAGRNVFSWASDILEGLESLWTKPLQYAARAPEDAPVLARLLVGAECCNRDRDPWSPRLSFDKTLERLKQWRLRLDEHWSRFEPWALNRALGSTASTRGRCVLRCPRPSVRHRPVGAHLRACPGREELRSLGEMPQATTLYDVQNRPVFTIFKEYRIEVPLARCRLICAGRLSRSKTSGSRITAVSTSSASSAPSGPTARGA